MGGQRSKAELLGACKCITVVAVGLPQVTFAGGDPAEEPYRQRLMAKLTAFTGRIWRPWTGDRGSKRLPNIGDHTLFSIMTTEPNAIVEPIHEKAMPVMLMTPDDVKQWLRGSSVEDALKMQKPAPDDAIVMRPEEKKAA